MLKHHLLKEGDFVTLASDGARALSLFIKHKYDLIVLDIMMPEMDGFEVCRKIRSEGDRTPIIFLTARTDEFDEVLGLEIGADDFIRKPFSIKTFQSRVRALLRRSDSPVIDTEKIQIKGIEIRKSSYNVLIDGSQVDFPRKEFELLTFLASNPNKVFSRSSLLNQVWSDDVYVVDRTVDVHIGRIRKKLGPYRDLLETVVGIGYQCNTQY
ncbi:MAG: response regulator transcription factor [Candidatus Marinimicrobia bacterium]|nr:response regulator transcription factor [Candidatus Neomarinimicrobiota bacterium]